MTFADFQNIIIFFLSIKHFSCYLFNTNDNNDDNDIGHLYLTSFFFSIGHLFYSSCFPSIFHTKFLSKEY